MGERGRSAWILGPIADSLLVLGAPLLSLVAILPLSMVVPSEAIWVMVMTFGSVGHHFPGFLRTYGDESLFRRYRLRFVVAPVLVFAAAWWFAERQLYAVLLVSLVWSIWHGMMQHYGFMRIYDAKAGGKNPTTARLDWWITCAWFVLCLTWSPEQAGSVLDGFRDVGFPAPSPEMLRWVGYAAVALTAGVTTAYVAHLARARRRGERVSAQKLFLLASTAALLWFSRVHTKDPFLSVALFEVLHDVQYLAIVWAFNRRVVNQGGGGLARPLFRAGVLRPMVYVGLCLAWGSLGYFAEVSGEETGVAARSLAALLVTSAILHFYYDGFIWKVRQSAVRSGLDLETKGAGKDGGGTARRDAVHLLAFCGVLALLYSVETGSTPRDELAHSQNMVRSVPDSATAHRNLAAALVGAGRAEEAQRHLRVAIDLAPRVAQTRVSLSMLLADRDPKAAIAEAEAAIELDPDLAEAYAARGYAQMKAGELRPAARSLEAAVKRGDASARTLNNLGLALARTGRNEEAQGVLRRAVEADGSHIGARLNLGLSYSSSGDWARAAEVFEKLVALDPRFVDGHNSLGAAYLKLGRYEDAERAFAAALEVDPDFVPAQRNLALLRARQGAEN